jgi:hypothetical protein
MVKTFTIHLINNVLNNYTSVFSGKFSQEMDAAEVLLDSFLEN